MPEDFLKPSRERPHGERPVGVFDRSEGAAAPSQLRDAPSGDARPPDHGPTRSGAIYAFGCVPLDDEPVEPFAYAIRIEGDPDRLVADEIVELLESRYRVRATVLEERS